MSKQIVNVGSSPNFGDGDPLRTAFRKVNENFDELYAGNFAAPDQTSSNLVPSINATYDLGSATNNWADLHVADFIYLNGARLEINSAGSLLVDGLPTTQDLVGSVFADDSTLLVDGVNGTIPGYISIAELKAEVAASTDFADFQTRISLL